jgi:hypothetical protein
MIAAAVVIGLVVRIPDCYRKDPYMAQVFGWLEVRSPVALADHIRYCLPDYTLAVGC